MIAALSLAPNVGAHTELRQAWPGPGPAVGGSIDKIEFWFWAPVTEPTIQLEGPHGEQLSGEINRLAPDRLRLEFDPLHEPGEHKVTYQITAPDNESTTSAYVFTYDPEAEPIALPSVLLEADSGGSVAFWIVSLVAIAAGAFLLLGGRGDVKKS